MNKKSAESNEPNLLGNATTGNYEQDRRIEELIKLIFGNESETIYEILVGVDTEIFKKRFKSSSEFYRILSNSNQTSGLNSHGGANTNRNWWKLHFQGGYYKTYECEDKLYIYFNLEIASKEKLPNELQIRSRIFKALRYKPTILIGMNNIELKKKLVFLEDCFSSFQVIGNLYTQRSDGKV